MPLEAGTRLGVFEILAPLGKGGMGEVYRARDTKLEREVAVKILPEEMAKRPERMARFQREAKLLAALDHPHIAAIHGLHQEDGQHFLVMELLDGETLAARLRRGPLPVQDALEVGREIAEALESAHDTGIIHRDLKPSNVMLTAKGKAKVLDFGLARVVEQERVQSGLNTETTPDETGTGVIVGTAPYMSPEQARGEEVDHRTDIWSFGCVLYETLTGRRAFPGVNTSDAIAAVLEHDPDWQALPEAAGLIMRSLLKPCLRKDKARRLHDIADVRIEIEEALSEPDTAVPRAVLPARRSIAYGVGAALLAGLGFWALALQAPQATHTPTRLNISIPGADSYGTLALSPDGTRVASTARVDRVWGLYLRPLDRLETVFVGDYSARANPPFFSTDGKWLGFFDSSTNTLKKVPVEGGVPITICNASDPRGASWGPDDTILFTPDPHSGLWRVSAEGGAPGEVTRPEEGENSHRFPDILPGGHAALFTMDAPSGRQDEARIALLSLETGAWRILVQGGSFGRYVGTGHIVYARNGSLLAVPFDLDSLEVTGAAVPVLDDVSMESVESGIADFSISRSGAVAYISASSVWVPEERTLVWVDRQGRIEPLSEDRRGFGNARLSPDAGQLAVSIAEGLNADVWLYDLTRDTKSRFTFGKTNYAVLWTPDARYVVFSSNREGAFNLFRKPADGSAGPERLTRSKGWQWPTGVSPDGRFLAYMQQEAGTGTDIWVLPLEGGDREPQLIAGTRFVEGWGAFSPDGSWLAYVSDETGRREVYVRPFPGPGRRWPISTDGGWGPVWSPDGRELFFRQGRKLMAVPVRTQPTFQPGSPRVLFEGSFSSMHSPSEYDVSPDGQRFVMIQEPEDVAPEMRQIIYIPDFAEELKAKMAEAGQ